MSTRLIQQLKSLARIDSQLHGPAHWARVVKLGERLARTIALTERELFCVRLFGWTHDLARTSDGADEGHGEAGAAYLPTVIDACGLTVPDDCLAVVTRAIAHHNGGVAADGAVHLGWLDALPWRRERCVLTVGACWDADRLDLLRLGIEPDPARMSTPFWDDVLGYARRLHAVE